MSREPLSSVDAAWLRMEDPTNLMMINGIFTFPALVDMEHLRAIIKYRFLKFNRFRQRVVQPALSLHNAYWEDDPNFDLDSHIQRIALPAPGDQTALQELVSSLMSHPLDFSKPLWQIHVVENYGEGCAIVTRLHHCIADGMSLVFVLLSMTDLSAKSPWPKPPKKKKMKKEGLITGLVKQASTAVTNARDVTGKILSESREAIINPSRALELAQQGTDGAMAAGRLVGRLPDPQTRFKGSLGVAKRAAWSRPLPLKDIKEIKNTTGGTVNDVLVSAMTGGLRRYMISNGDVVDGLNFRAAIPVNLRKQDEMDTLGNKFGLVFLSLPVGIADPLERLMEVRQRMNELKDSSEAIVSFGILQALGVSPAEVQSTIVKLFAMKATAVLTNVPGPRMPLYLAGQPIEDIMFWVPQSGRVALGISILSYNNKVYLGVVTDKGLVPDPESIIEGFYKEYEDLMHLVQQVKEVEAMEARLKEMEAQVAKLEAEQQEQTTSGDDLKKIKGIGPKVAGILQENGITSYAQLAQANEEELRHILDSAGSRYRTMDPTTWPAQAQEMITATT